MPGIVGIVGAGSSRARLDAALGALLHFESYRSRVTAVAPTVLLGQIWRGGDESARDTRRDEATGTVVLVNGYALDARPPQRRLDARALLERYLSVGPLAFDDLDGAFVIAVADPASRTVLVVNDRLGTLPVYYSAHDGRVAFAPEAKAVFPACGLEPELSPAGVVSFLNAGYCVGKETLFSSVRVLEPGSMLTIPFDGAASRTRNYWRIVYASAGALVLRAEAERALHDAAREAHRALTADATNGYDLMLSGGWDSRGLLAFLDEIGARPRKALAWGKTRDVPDSDPYIAERLAARFGVPFEFVAYDSDALVENAAAWCYLSELANDNTGWFAEGAPMLAGPYRSTADFTLVGDEAWGWNGHPRSEVEARNAVLPATLVPAVEECLSPRVRDEARTAYEGSIDSVLEACGNDHPIDRRDFLYLHGRVARFIFALGYYKELAFEVRRPFLLGGVLEVVARLPRRFRIDKNLYISMLARYFPQIAAFAPRRANSLPDWPRDIRVKPALRSFFLELLDERRLDGVLGSVLDAAAVARLRDAFFSERPRAATARAARSVARGLPLHLKQRIRAAGLHPGARGVQGPARGRADVLRCIALVSLLQSTLPRFRVRVRDD